MSRLYNRHFKIGVAVGTILFAIGNLVVIILSDCHHCVRIVGFPLPIYQEFHGNLTFTPEGSLVAPDDFTLFSFENLIANVILLVLCCFGIGLVSEEFGIWRRINTPKR